MAEWLRRPTRNRLGLSRVGSSPASVGVYDTSYTNFVRTLFVCAQTVVPLTLAASASCQKPCTINIYAHMGRGMA